MNESPEIKPLSTTENLISIRTNNQELHVSSSLSFDKIPIHQNNSTLIHNNETEAILENDSLASLFSKDSTVSVKSSTESSQSSKNL